MLRLAFLIIIVASSASSAFAQPIEIPRELSFEKAKRIFLDHNPDLTAARAHATRQASDSRTGALWPNPSLSLQLNRTQPDQSPFNNDERAIALEQDLLYPGEFSARRKFASASADAAWDSYRETEALLYEKLRQMYASAVVARQRLSLLEKATNSVRRSLEVARIRFEEGDISSLETSRIGVALALYEDALEEAKKIDRDSRIELAYFLAPQSHADHHEEDESLITVADSIVYQPVAVDYDHLVETALAQRGIISSSASAQTASEALLSASRHAKLPDLSITAGYRGETEGGMSAPGFTIGLNLGLPVFNRGGPQIAAARATLEHANAGIDLARRRVELDVHDAYEQLMSYETRISRISSGILPATDRMLDDAIFVYTEGEIPLVDLLDTIEASLDAGMLRIELYEQHALSRFAMDRALGIGPLDSSPLN